MSLAIGPRPPAAPVAPREDAAALTKVATDLQSVFAEQLYKAMRETVPRGEGVVDGGGGEEMFTSLMDQHLAADTPTQWGRGLTDAIVRQLRGALARQGDPSPDAPDASAAPTARAATSDTAPTTAAPPFQPLETARR